LAIFIWPKRSFAENIATVLKIVTVYTFTFGVLTSVGVLRAFPSLASYLTSPNLLEFMVGNFRASAIVAQGVTVMEEPLKNGFMATAGIEPLVLMILTPILLVGIFLYIGIVMPWAYLAYVIVSVPVNAVLTAGPDSCVFIGEGSNYCIKAAVKADPITFKNFMAAFFSGMIVFGSKFFKTFAERFVSVTLESKKPVLRKIGKYILYILQGVMLFLLFITIGGGLSMPTIYNEATAEKISIWAKLGEIYGVVVVILLAIWLEVLIIKRIRFRLKAISSGVAGLP
jgi:hypothetical protein